MCGRGGGSLRGWDKGGDLGFQGVRGGKGRRKGYSKGSPIGMFLGAQALPQNVSPRESSPERHPRLLPIARTPARAPDSRNAQERGAVGARERSARERGERGGGLLARRVTGPPAPRAPRSVLLSAGCGRLPLHDVDPAPLAWRRPSRPNWQRRMCHRQAAPGEPRGARLGQQGGATKQQGNNCTWRRGSARQG